MFLFRYTVMDKRTFIILLVLITLFFVLPFILFIIGDIWQSQSN